MPESGNQKSKTVRPEDFAADFMMKGIQGNYDQLLDMVSTSEYPMLGAMMCALQKQTAASISLKADKASLASYYGGDQLQGHVYR